MFLLKEKQTTLDNFVNKKTSQLEKKQAVIDWIILDIQPFKVVEGEAFRNMISNFDPNYQLPTRNTIKNFIIKSFNERKNLVKNYIKNIPGKVSITTDIWSSLKNESFLGITVHFIDENWMLRHFTLDIFKFEGSHTGQLIADKIYEILVEFGLESKTISMTTDNASNMVSCAKILESKFEHTFIHYQCVTHILNIIVIAELNTINTSVKKTKKINKNNLKILKELDLLRF